MDHTGVAAIRDHINLVFWTSWADLVTLPAPKKKKDIFKFLFKCLLMFKQMY